MSWYYPDDPIDYFSVLTDSSHFKRYDFEYPISRKLTYSSIQFDCNQDLIYQ